MSKKKDTETVIAEFVEKFHALQREALREYAPVVKDILLIRSRDVRHIEATLDGLLDFCGHDGILHLFKSLCRYYYTLDPVAAAQYVHYYREQYDPESIGEMP